MLHTIREIAFIASDIPEGQTLISGIKKGIETAILDPNRDAIAQIGETLKGKKYSAIHIICHGAPGHLQLGNTGLNIETLPQYTFADTTVARKPECRGIHPTVRVQRRPECRGRFADIFENNRQLK
jgi:hypothetical protein